MAGDGAAQLNVLLVGEESAGVQALRMLAKTEHRVVAVLAKAHDASGDAVRGVSVHALAQRLGHRTLPPELVKDPAFADEVRRMDVDLILNIHSLFIMQAAVAASARLGAFNLHPGPLPAYAGLNSPSWAILHGRQEHGVTLHWMEAGIDTGPIAYQAMFPIGETDTGLTVAGRCVREGLRLVAALLDDAAAQPPAIPRLYQDPSQRSYYGREVPYGGALDLSWPARRVVDFVRACDYHPLPSPWGYPAARAGDLSIAIARARMTGEPATAPPGTVVPAADAVRDAVRVACGDEWIEVTHVWSGDQRRPATEVLDHVERLASVA